MRDEGVRDAVAVAAPPFQAQGLERAGGTVALAVAGALAACGGGGGGGGGGFFPASTPSAAGAGAGTQGSGAGNTAPGTGAGAAPAAPPAGGGTTRPGSPIVAGADQTTYTAPANAGEAARFLAQATLGTSKSEITALQAMSYAAWLDKQFALPRTQNHCDWLTSKGYDTGVNNQFHAFGLDSTLWRKLVSSPDLLRQRVTLALTEILVVSVENLITWFPQFAVGNYVDVLEQNVFGNYRKILEVVTLSPAMSAYLTYRGNVPANPVTGSQPDENYAREIMQLFTIGLYKLNNDGSLVLNNGAPVETYKQADVSGLARVFTGWYCDTAGVGDESPIAEQRPLKTIWQLYESGVKDFLGVRVPAGPQNEADAAKSLTTALDTLFAHPNVPPFIGKQLIQRLVTSNPSPAYINRVSQAFINNGQGVRGDMKAVIRAILLDDEARNPAIAVTPAFGKVREPVVRFLNWARAFNVTSPSGNWDVGTLSDPATTLGQSPLHSPSVFNFFRPGYVPGGTKAGEFSLTVPELQITTETSVSGYINFMQRVISGSALQDLRPDYTSLLNIAANAGALLAEINLVVASASISDATLAKLTQAVNTIDASTDAGKRNRVYAALTLVMAAPEYIVQK